MKVVGIITEYNPFHNGHAYQIQEIKKRTGADYVVVAMSGDFVQRGTPAIIDKYARTQMALSCGVNLVIELPTLWATASAEYFAMAGVTLFEKMGCVDILCFGAETDDLPLLSVLAEIIAEEPDGYRELLSVYLKEGLAFPVARGKALCSYLKEQEKSASATQEFSSKNVVLNLDAVSSILSEPNNILAIEYLKALKRRNSSIQPYLLKREGAGYHDTEFYSATNDTFSVFQSAGDHIEYGTSQNAGNNIRYDTSQNIGNSIECNMPPTASATAIRRELETNFKEHTALFTDLATLHAHTKALHDTMPSSALDILNSYLEKNCILHANNFSSILGYQLLTASAEDLASIGDSNTDIANRIYKNRMQFSSFEQFCELNKSKDVTYTRISRILLHFILGISNQTYLSGKELDYIPYLRILGFKQDSTAILKALKGTATVPVISKLADAHSILDTGAMAILEKDIFAADLYEQIGAIKKGTTSRSEYIREIVRV